MSLRKSFKATPIAQIKNQEEKVKNSIYNSEGAKYLSIDEGSNKFRIYPAHPDSKSFIYPVSRWWLKREITYNKDGKEVTEVVNKPVFNAKIHSNNGKDIVDEYLKFAKRKLAETIDDVDELEEAYEKLTHWQHGIRLNTQWAVYADKIKGDSSEFGLLTISNTIKNKLNELAITEDDDEEPITTDPFTDPDDGKAIIVKYDKNEQDAKNRYKVNIEYKKNYSLTDEQLETFSEQKSLASLYDNVYSKRDFDLAIECLKYFDTVNGYGFISDDEFIEVIEELSEQYPEQETDENSSETKKSNKQSSAKKEAKKPVKETEDIEEDEEEEVEESTTEDEEGDEEETDLFDNMNRLELKRYIKQNELDIVVKNSMSDDELRNTIREYLNDDKSIEKSNKKVEEEEKETKKLSPLEEAKLKLNKLKGK